MSDPQRAATGPATADTRSEFGLKRVLGLRDVVAVEIGQTVGAGVFVLTGLAMASAGGSLPLAYVLAVTPFIFMYAAIGMLGSALPTTGGTYHYSSRFVSPTVATVGVWAYFICAILGAFPLYALTCAKYLQAIFPALPTTATALLILTIICATNIMGLAVAARVQIASVAVLLVTLVVFVITGLPGVEVANMAPMLPEGVGGLILAACLLTFTHTGSNGIIELGGEIKNPERNIPRSFLYSIPIVTVLYLLVGLVAVGTQPWAQVAGRTLTDTARSFMGDGLYTFFILGGGVLAILTTMNSTFMFGTKSIIRMAVDGWIPKRLAEVSERYSTPHWILLLIYVVSATALAVLGEESLNGFAALAAIGAILIFVPVMVAALRLKTLAPKAYERAPFKLKGRMYYAAPIIGIGLTLLTVAMLLVDLFSRPNGIAFVLLFVGLLAVGIVYAALRGPVLAPKIRAEVKASAGAGPLGGE